MNDESGHFDRVRELFHELCDLTPAQRDERLLDLTSDDLLRNEVASLLAHSDQRCDAIDEAPSRILSLLNDLSKEQSEQPHSTELRADVGAIIGPYTLHEIIGQGGMGVVHRATQEAPLRREVAIKLIRPGMATDAMLARFELERRTLAAMHHPNIATIYDAGMTDDGRPYFVMRLVRGQPMTEFCDERGLSINERLRLFSNVCDAVQHAHRRGVIHRDLKPSNVLIEEIDGVPTPQIIDFGIAKAFASDVEQALDETAPGLALGAPRYMSPEQAAHDGPVDTRADVYSLGVILYELVCGDTPAPAASLRKLRPSEITQFIQHLIPDPPSRRIAALNPEARSAVARQRSCTPRELARTLRGDLDWIVMKAIARDSAQRYESPADFAADLARRERRMPVEAGPPAWRYRAGRFLSRHRFASVAATIVLIATMTGMAGVLWQARLTRIEMRNSRQVNTFLHTILSSNNPWNTRGATLTLRDVLDDASERLKRSDELTPVTRARLHNTLSATYWGLGAFAAAKEHALQALQLFQTERGEAHPETLRALSNLSLINNDLGLTDEALALAERAAAISRRHLSPDEPLALSMRTNLAAILMDVGRAEEALAHYQAVATATERRGGFEERAQALTNVGGALAALGREDECRAYVERAYALAEEALGADHPVTLMALLNLGTWKQRNGEPADALRMLEDLHNRCVGALGEDHPETINYSRRYISALLSSGASAAAESLARRMLDLSMSAVGEAHECTINLNELVATSIGLQGRLDECLAYAQRWYDHARESRGETDAVTRRAAVMIAEVYDTIGEEEQEAHWRAVAAGGQLEAAPR